MKDWKNFTINKDTPILKALEIINSASTQICLVIDEDQRLVGAITDGDIRRGLLRGVQLNEQAEKVMNSQPIVVGSNVSSKEIYRLMNEKKIRQIPVLDSFKRVIDVVTLDKLLEIKQKDNHVILMAGGLGTRLASLTQNCPKPMLKVGEKPILERILKQFTEQGFVNFHFSVNYMAEIIENYFEGGDKFSCKINYLRENKRLGTAGPLSLLSSANDKPVIVMNGDLLTHVDFDELLNFHSEKSADITVCVREYEFQVPFGVIEIEDSLATSFKEKPSYSFKVNAGIYVIESSLFKLIPKDEYYDMSTFLHQLLELKKKIACFPILKEWIDVGREDDFRSAQKAFSE